MKRSLIDMYMNIADVISRKSTCIRKQVGCLITRNDRIISTGWNGTFSRARHCCDIFGGVRDLSNPEFLASHKDWSEQFEVHAEMNAILHSSGDLKECTMFCTLSPCLACAKSIIVSGIGSLYYREKYDRDIRSLAILGKNGVRTEQIL